MFFNVNPNPIYGIHDPIGLKYLSQCQNESGTVEHYLLYCPVFSSLRLELFVKLRRIISLLTFISPNYTCNLLLYGNPKYDDYNNRKIIEFTIYYIIDTNRFDRPFFSTD